MTVVDDLLAERDRLMDERQQLLERALNAEAEVEGLESARAGDDIAIETLRTKVEQAARHSNVIERRMRQAETQVDGWRERAKAAEAEVERLRQEK